MNTENSATKPIGSIKVDNLLINFTTEFQRLWDSGRSQAKPATFWRAAPAPDLLPGYFSLGDLVIPGHDSINSKKVAVVVCEGPKSGESTKVNALSPPIDFEQVWRSAGSTTVADCTIWRPIPPDGYVAMGMVCSDREKPSLNVVRCIREDLVVASTVGNLIWSDKSSGARQDLSAWSICPPIAQKGEIYLSPGTFAGVRGYSKPTTLTTYSLRMNIPLQINPQLQAPVLSGIGQPAQLEKAETTYIAKLPWFTVIDPVLSPIEQLRTTPSYLLERTDQYVLVGSGHNEDAASKTFKWTVHRVQTRQSLTAFALVTSIEFDSEWPINVQAPLINFSGRLDKKFAHADESGGWSAHAATEVFVVVSKNRTVAVYQMQSNYRLLREDRTQVTTELNYTDMSNLHLAEFSS
ncbi:Vps62-related protein [Pseudomonas umsongensis]|jgi:hypothetical protein|uniref:Vps62-related protein n=1 Tax=Pseudomonas umsongensis TaxID=198618 RepID=UPI0015B9EA57|nr:Vps62-related protein [Pseudomonas umsongensis]NWL18428.1 hypothetical protein [Pseudomonas umsongensis]